MCQFNIYSKNAMQKPPCPNIYMNKLKFVAEPKEQGGHVGLVSFDGYAVEPDGELNFTEPLL